MGKAFARPIARPIETHMWTRIAIRVNKRTLDDGSNKSTEQNQICNVHSLIIYTLYHRLSALGYNVVGLASLINNRRQCLHLTRRVKHCLVLHFRGSPPKEPFVCIIMTSPEPHQAASSTTQEHPSDIYKPLFLLPPCCLEQVACHSLFHSPLSLPPLFSLFSSFSLLQLLY